MIRRTPAEYVAHLRRITSERLLRVCGNAAQQTLNLVGIPMVRRETLRTEAVATSEYLNGWRVEREGPGQVALRNLSPHAGFVEYGRKRGRMPPISAILRWVEIKFNRGGAEGRRIAFLIARKIGERGVRGRHILRRVRPLLQTRVRLAQLRAATKYLVSGKG